MKKNFPLFLADFLFEILRLFEKNSKISQNPIFLQIRIKHGKIKLTKNKCSDCFEKNSKKYSENKKVKSEK
jgi:hypothetical protein